MATMDVRVETRLLMVRMQVEMGAEFEEDCNRCRGGSVRLSGGKTP